MIIVSFVIDSPDHIERTWAICYGSAPIKTFRTGLEKSGKSLRKTFLISHKFKINNALAGRNNF